MNNLERVQPYQLSFADFAEAVRLSSGVNRLDNGVSFSVYFNGDFAKSLPADVVEQTVTESRASAVVERLGMDAALSLGSSAGARDCLFAAGLIAVRGAWMASVMDAAASGVALGDAVTADYEALVDGFGHPWVEAQVAAHRGLSGKLPEVLAAAGVAAGRAVTDQIPDELCRGTVLASSSEFTVQATAAGVVTHDNRQLSSVPMVGSDVTVVYYKGQGQVFDHELALFSEPFIDPGTGDLALRVADKESRAQKLVLFNSMAAFAQLVEAQGLDKRLVGLAMDLKAAAPKSQVGELPAGVGLAGNGRFVGKVVGIDQRFVIQDQGQGQLVGHRLTDFEVRPRLGAVLDVQRQNGRAVVRESGPVRSGGVEL